MDINPEHKQQIGRLALRQEGGNWNAYYALTDTMNDAVYLGSIRMAAVTGHPERKQLFMEMMRDIVSDIIEKETGTRPTWGGPKSAPEHERAGRA